MSSRWPTATAIAIYWIATGVLLRVALRATDGHLVYPLDDAYVHMAVAKNVALHHVWGVTPYGFNSSTSSPLWTLLLAVTYMVFGVGTVAPLVFNVAAGTLVVYTIGELMRARSASPWLTLSVLVAAIFVAPLPTLTLTGMEHTLHALATVWFAFAAASVLADHPAATTHLTRVALLGALVTSLRYEGAFTVAVAASLFAINRQRIEAAVVSLAGAAPITAYGLWSAAHGWYWLPNSVLLKGRAPAPTPAAVLAFVVGSPALHNLVANPHILLLVVAALVLLIVASVGIVRGEDVFLLTMLVGTALLHMQLARAGWFYRYEAYLLIFGATVFGVMAAERLPPFRTWVHGSALPLIASAAALIAVAGFPFASRALNALRNTPTAASNIYHQQYQVGLFLDRFYRGQPVALNDIGAVGFLADVRLLDIYGLADVEIARLKRSDRYNTAQIAASAAREGTAIAMIYPSWLGEYGGVPPGWTKAGEWGVRDNVVLGENAVSFFAVTPSERPRLVANLRRFAPSLPAAVVQAGEYTR